MSKLAPYFDAAATHPTHRFLLNGAYHPLTTLALMEAYAAGQHVSLYNIATGKYVNGHIQGIRNESGSALRATPRHLLVTVAGHGESVEFYVKTPA